MVFLIGGVATILAIPHLKLMLIPVAATTAPTMRPMRACVNSLRCMAAIADITAEVASAITAVKVTGVERTTSRA